MPGAPGVPPPTAGEETGAVQCSQSEGAGDVPADVKGLWVYVDLTFWAHFDQIPALS